MQLRPGFGLNDIQKVIFLTGTILKYHYQERCSGIYYFHHHAWGRGYRHLIRCIQHSRSRKPHLATQWQACLGKVRDDNSVLSHSG
jgi:hypothetical protein